MFVVLNSLRSALYCINYNMWRLFFVTWCNTWPFLWNVCPFFHFQSHCDSHLFDGFSQMNCEAGFDRWTKFAFDLQLWSRLELTFQLKGSQKEGKNPLLVQGLFLIIFILELSASAHCRIPEKESPFFLLIIDWEAALSISSLSTGVDSWLLNRRQKDQWKATTTTGKSKKREKSFHLGLVCRLLLISKTSKYFFQNSQIHNLMSVLIDSLMTFVLRPSICHSFGYSSR